VFIEAKDDGGGGDNWSAINRAKIQSNHHHQQTNTQSNTDAQIKIIVGFKS